MPFILWPRYTVIGFVTILDFALFKDEYVAHLKPLLDRYGAKLSTLKQTTLLAKSPSMKHPPSYVVTVTFPSKTVARAFFDSDLYNSYNCVRDRAARLVIVGLDALDSNSQVARAARMAHRPRFFILGRGNTRHV